MTNTVPATKLEENRTKEREAVALINGLRRAANQRYQTTRTKETTSNTPTSIWVSDDMPLRSVWEVEVQVCAIASDGSAGAGYRRVGRFRRASGASVAVGVVATPIADSEDTVAWDVTLAASGNSVQLTVTGDAALAVNWSAFVQVKEAR